MIKNHQIICDVVAEEIKAGISEDKRSELRLLHECELIIQSILYQNLISQDRIYGIELLVKNLVVKEITYACNRVKHIMCVVQSLGRV